MKRWWLQAVCAALIVAAGGVGFWLGRDATPIATSEPTENADASADPAPTPAVQVASVTNGSVRRAVDVYGTVQTAAGSSVSVSVPYDAIVQRVLVRPGVVVSTETPVVEVGPTAEAQLQLQQAHDAVAAADRNVEDAKRRLAEQLATNTDVTTAEQAQQAARTQLSNLQQRGIQENKTLNAGVAGVVAPLTIQKGQVVPAGTPLLTIDDDRSLEAVLGVEPADAAKLKPGDSVVLRDVRGPTDGPTTTTQVRLVSREIDAQTRLQNVLVTLPKDGPLARGAFVDAQIELDESTGLVVPRSAVLPDDDDSVVFVVNDGKATRLTVDLVARGREECVVKSDALKVGDTVVTVGNAELEDGMAVAVAPAATEPATTESTTDSTSEPATAQANEPTSSPASSAGEKQ